MNRDEWLKKLDSYIEVEDKAIKLYKEGMEMVDHSAFRLIFEELMLDSTKHKRIFEAVKEEMTKTSDSEWDTLVGRKIGRYVVPIELERHIKLEEKMIDSLQEELGYYFFELKDISDIVAIVRDIHVHWGNN